METILYIYKKRNLQEPLIETVTMKDYLLVRAGMDLGENRWFSHSLEQPEHPPTVKHREEERERPLLWRWRDLRDRREARRLERRRQERLQRDMALIRTDIQSFLARLGQLVDDRYDCHCVYGDAVRRLLLPTERGASDEACGLAQLWQEYWQIPEFDAYLRDEWAEPLLKNIRLHHFVVLGTAPCIPTVLSRCAQRMKSLRWFLPEQDCTGELQEFVEDFYEDWGLAAVLQPLEGKRVYARLLLETSEPVCVLDFSGEPHIPAGGLAAGSIWIDFCSVEEKARRICEGGEAVSYFSLKETWKHARKS